MGQLFRARMGSCRRMRRLKSRLSWGLSRCSRIRG